MLISLVKNIKLEGDSNMNRKEFVRKFAKESGCYIYQAEKYLDVFRDILVDTLKSGETVRLFDFGTFYLKNRKPIMKKNPHTGENIWCPERKIMKFRAIKGIDAQFKETEDRETEEK